MAFLSFDKTHASIALYSLIRKNGSSFQNLLRRCIRKSSYLCTGFIRQDEMRQILMFLTAMLLTKVESPIVGATKLHHIEGAVKSLDVRLTADDIRYLEEPYVPHNLSGVMAVNKPAMSEEPVWVTAAKNK